MIRKLVVGSTLLLLTGCFVGDDESQSYEKRLEHIKKMETNPSEDGLARRTRSIEILKAEGVPYIEHLPVIVSETESTRRSKEEVAKRAIALCIVAAKGEGLEQKLIDDLVEQFKIKDAFTPKERAFIKSANPSEHDRIQFAWRYECYWVMLWALGYVDELARPDTICDVATAITLLRDKGADAFIRDAELRPQSELLDAADLIYRYHWATEDARINNRDAPTGLDGGIVMERHYALNWLIGYLDQEWDDVTTDT